MLHRKLRFDMKQSVRETRPSLNTIICFWTMQWLPHSGQFVNKANSSGFYVRNTFYNGFLNVIEGCLYYRHTTNVFTY